MGYAFRGILNIIWKFGQKSTESYFLIVYLLFCFCWTYELQILYENEKYLNLLHILYSWEFVCLDNSDHSYYVIYRSTILRNFIINFSYCNIIFYLVLDCSTELMLWHMCFKNNIFSKIVCLNSAIIMTKWFDKFLEENSFATL